MNAEIVQGEASRHKCLIYEGHPSAQLPVVIPLLIDGLTTNWRCLYLGSPEMVWMVDKALKKQGVDTAHEEYRGALMLSSERNHLDGGSFDPASMIEGLRALSDEAIHDGFSGLCATGDMRWELGADDNFDRLVEYEVLLEQLLREKPIRGICQYHCDVLPARAVRDALFTHKSAFVGDVLNRDNLFYMPPEVLLAASGDSTVSKQGEWMCKQIIRIQNAEISRDKALKALGESEAHQRMLAEQLADMNRTLERRVSERTAELEAANQNLEAFSYSVSHDLRAPLRHITGFATILGESSSVSLDAKGRHYVSAISESAQRMERMIDDLLSFSRVGRAELARSRVDLNHLVEEARREVSVGVNGREIVWHVDPLPTVDADPSLLRLVLVNLLSNALKYSSKRSPSVIEVGVAPGEASERVIFVRDNGAGFSMQYVDRLFGVFQRLHKREEFEGTGVGLANVRRIVQRHGGRTWAEGQPGNGATFYFSLPAKSRTPKADS